MTDDSPFNRMPNILWLMHWSGRRYPDMPRSKKELAAILGIQASRVARTRDGTMAMRNDEVDRWYKASGLQTGLPEFKVTWLSYPEERFARTMQSISYGMWQSDQPLDPMSTGIPPLARAEVVEEEQLARLLGRAKQRGDLGESISLDMPVSAEVTVGRRFGITVRNPVSDMVAAIGKRATTSVLLFRPLRSPFFKAAPCPQLDCLHLLTHDGQLVESYLPRGRQRLQLMVARKTGDPLRPYGFEVSNTPERIELLLAVFGRAIPELRKWSEAGGVGRPEEAELLRRNLAGLEGGDVPYIAGRMLIDVVDRPRQ